MKTMKYEIIIANPNAEITVKTNDLDYALNEFITAYQQNGATHAHITDTTTGEVIALFDAESETLWQSDEVTAHMLAFISACRLAEVLFPEVPDEPAKSEDGVPAVPSFEEFLLGLLS